MSNFISKVQDGALELAMDYVLKNPAQNLPKLLELVERFDINGSAKKQIAAIRPIANDADNNWNKFVGNLCEDIDPNVLKAIVRNFFINAGVAGLKKQEESRKLYNCNIPWAILLDPTSACNLKCTGCWAAEYGDKLNMSYVEMASVIQQAKNLGTHMFLFSGGEPLVRKQDIIRLCKSNSDCQFVAFTNGTLIDEEFADELLELKNFMPAISVEGFEEDTDFRRGKGTFSRVENAMAILRERKLPFGISCCYTSKNTDTIGSEEYFDQMIAWGAKFCWFFTYMPVGNDAAPELMVSAEQRKFMYEQVRKFRETKPIFTLDFWNDGEYSEGCVAGGKVYLHINANGDYEPCAFIHYSDSNVRNKTLLEALQSPLFKEYQSGQPWNANHLRPCPLLDNPKSLVHAVETSGAHSTDLKHPEDVHDLAAKCELTSKRWSVVADDLWQATKGCTSCEKCNSSNT